MNLETQQTDRAADPVIPELLTIPEAAARLGVSRRGLRGIAEKHGYLVTIGRKPLLNAAHLEELVDLCRGQTRATTSGCTGVLE